MSKETFEQADPLYRLKRIHILVVDNDPALASLVTSILTKLGFINVHTANDAFSAVQLMKKQKIDMLITDWDLKPMHHKGIARNSAETPEDWPEEPVNGAHFVRFLRSSRLSPNPYLAVIMMTGAALRDDISYARDSGANEVILKPIDAETLVSRIIMVIENDRPFITAKNYKGPCRRRAAGTIDHPERRVADVKLIKYQAV